MHQTKHLQFKLVLKDDSRYWVSHLVLLTLVDQILHNLNDTSSGVWLDLNKGFCVVGH